MLKFITGLCILLLIGSLGAFFASTQAGQNFEEELGLSWLFQLRGAQQPPESVIIVSLDQLSAQILHLPDNPDLWPRSFHASLIDKLNQQNPALIAFNIHFGQNREPDKDALLVKAMANRKNVVLSNYLKQVTIPTLNGKETLHLEHIIEPIEQFSQVALGTAPFPLPKSSSTIKEFWTYKPSAGDMATFPISIFQFYVLKKAYPEIIHLFNRINPAFLAGLPASFDELVNQGKADQAAKLIQTTLLKDSGILRKYHNLLEKPRYPQKVTHLLRSWADLLKADKKLYLNYYGDIGAITTVPFYQVLANDALERNLFKDKIVLVGYGEDLEPEKQQGFYSVYSKASGQSISPIEIAATALANVMEKSWLKPLPSNEKIALVLLWGVLLSGIFRLLPYRSALALSAVSVFAYVYLAWFLFRYHTIWLPLAIPTLQAATLFLLESAKHYLKIKKLTAYYLPEQIFAINGYNPETMDEYGTLLEGVCMATDAGQYTPLSENMAPLELNKLMNDYYAVIFPKVKKSGGLITDVKGDAMLAVWVDAKDNGKNRENACSAAIGIKSAIAEFNQKTPHVLSTRIGLHYGSMRLGNVGAKDHYEFRAVGDTINTTVRIEELNKILGTQLLASSAVLEKLPDIFARELGVFLLKGKTNAVEIFELIANSNKNAPINAHLHDFLELFALALQQFKENNWESALALFEKAHKLAPDDGPTLFYLDYLKNNLPTITLTSDQRSAVIDVGNSLALSRITQKNHSV